MAMKNEGSKHATALSNFIHKLKKEGVSYVIKWSIKARASHYKSGSRKCMLCIKQVIFFNKSHNDRATTSVTPSFKFIHFFTHIP